jgi:hypothetical protein
MLKKIGGRWALVSKSDPDKVLKWFGSSKPSEEEVSKEERRVNYFKHKAKECFDTLFRRYTEKYIPYFSLTEKRFLESTNRDFDLSELKWYVRNHPVLVEDHRLATLLSNYQKLEKVGYIKFQEDIVGDISDLIQNFLIGKKGVAQKQLDKVKDQLKKVNESIAELEKIIKELS